MKDYIWIPDTVYERYVCEVKRGSVWEEGKCLIQYLMKSGYCSTVIWTSHFREQYRNHDAFYTHSTTFNKPMLLSPYQLKLVIDVVGCHSRTCKESAYEQRPFTGDCTQDRPGDKEYIIAHYCDPSSIFLRRCH